jgi:hypothetical protein
MQRSAVSRCDGLGVRVRKAKRLKMGAALLFLCVSGCVHRPPPEDSILSALSGPSSERFFVRDSVPEFVVFRDARTARIFKGITRGGKYQIAPKDELLLCPGVAAPGKHGYVLGARVGQVTHETAVVTLSETCRQFVPNCDAGQACVSIGGAVEYDSQYLVQKTNRGWRVVRPLNHSVMVLD